MGVGSADRDRRQRLARQRGRRLPRSDDRRRHGRRRGRGGDSRSSRWCRRTRRPGRSRSARSARPTGSTSRATKKPDGRVCSREAASSPISARLSRRRHRITTRARAHPVRGKRKFPPRATPNRDEPSRPRKRTPGADGEESVMETNASRRRHSSARIERGDPGAVGRAEAVLGKRTEGAFPSCRDAQHVVAREAGSHLAGATGTRTSRPRNGSTVRTSSSRRTSGIGQTSRSASSSEARVALRHLGGGSRDRARRSSCWLGQVAARVVDEYAVNVNRSGVVFVQSNEGR